MSLIENAHTASVYIHIPFCKSKCDYCDFFSVPEGKVDNNYIKAVCEHLAISLKAFNIKNIPSIYIGGGTPSLLTPQQLTMIFSAIDKSLLTNSYEITIEMNVTSATKDLLETAANYGVNRISLGVQSLCDTALKAVHRPSTKQISLEAIQMLKTFWHGDISIDIIAGLPYENQKEFLSNLKTICSYKPSHISLYSLTIVKGTPLFSKIENGMEYNRDYTDDLWIKGRNFLLENGFEHYEVSSFAMPGKQSIHNMRYWQQLDYIGVGSGATGTVGDLRYTNTIDIEKYTQYWLEKDHATIANPTKISHTEVLNQKEKQTEFFMLGLRTARGISANDYKAKFGIALKNLDNIKGLSCKKTKLDTIYFLTEDNLLFLDKILLSLI